MPPWNLFHNRRRHDSPECGTVSHTASFRLTSQIVIRKIGKNLPGTTLDSFSPIFSAPIVK